MGHLITTYGYKNQGDGMFDDSDTLIHIFFIPAKFSRHDKISRKIDPLFSPFTIILTEYTLAGTDLLCMLNWGTQWTMVSYLKK